MNCTGVENVCLDFPPLERHSESEWKKLGRQNEMITTVMIALN